MTGHTPTLHADNRPKRRWLRWITLRRRGSARADGIETLSERTLRDIGLQRDPLDSMAIRTLHDAMRYSG